MRKFIQFLGLYLSTFSQKHKKHIIIAALFGFFATLFFIHAYPLYVRIIGRQYKRIGVIGRFTDNTLPIAIQNQISLGLTSITATGSATAAVASGWEVDQTGKIFTFHLYPNLLWHDGNLFTAREVNYKLKGAKFEYPDKNTVRVTLEDSYAPLPVLLAKPILRPNLIGLGMYKAVKLRRSADYILELSLQPQDKSLPMLSYKYYPSVSEAILAFKLGEVDILQDLPDIEDLRTWKGILIRENTLYDRFVGIFLNLNDTFFQAKEVRQALTYAIPNVPNWQRVLTPISPLSWGYSSKIRLYTYDPEAAQKILTRSPIGSASAQLVLSTFPALLPSAQTVVDAWKKVGLDVKIRVENTIPDNFQMFLMTTAIPADPDQYQYWQSTQEETNISKYSNLKIDKLLEDGRRTMDMEKRKKIYADFQRYLVDDAPVVFLYYPKVYTVERK